MSDETSRAVLTEYAARHGAEPRLGCSLVSHRDLGMCSACKSPHDGQRVGADRELAAWRLLAMAERGIPRQPWETPPSDPSQTSASVDALPADRAATPTAHSAELANGSTCGFCGKPADVWPSKDCEEPQEHTTAVYDCDCGDVVTIADAIASPKQHRRCHLIGSGE